ncbi:hypothetical protein V8F20_003609 [Naviculisporaceae sp. PSN 640]
MSTDEQQISIPSLVIIMVVGALALRYFFFSPSGSSASARGGPQNREALMRSREAAAERIMQMFPQVDRRTVLWDLQRNGGNITATTERILAGRMETPPITFQPPPPPGQNQATTGQQRAATTTKQPEKPAQPDLITRYNLKDKLEAATAETSGSDVSSASAGAKAKSGWSSNREERQSTLQRRRDEMILQARKKMEAKIAAEKAAAAAAGGSA